MYHWKIETFWLAVIATAIASFIVWFSAGYRIGLKTPPSEPITYRIIVEHARAPQLIAEAEVIEQAIFPIPPGKRRPIEEQLSPEMLAYYDPWTDCNQWGDDIAGVALCRERLLAAALRKQEEDKKSVDEWLGSNEKDRAVLDGPPGLDAPWKVRR